MPEHSTPVEEFRFPEVNVLRPGAPWRWLREGWNDLRSAPAASLFYGAVLALMGAVLGHYFGEAAYELALVNPTLVERGGPPVVFEEGCLSFPGIYAEVERPERCTVRAFDPQGRPIEATYSGFTSRIVQHEHDHLEGILLVDRMSPADKIRHRAALEELVERFRREQRHLAKSQR